MKVTRESAIQFRSVHRVWALAFATALLVIVGFTPAPAHAITRSQIISRAHTWVAKRVIYSQTRYYGGYRRDCSGFVSMAWRLKKSYTSRTIHRVARRVPISQLKPGDAVRTPGHVAIFVRWKNKSRRTYVAMEEYTWGRPAAHRVKRMRRGAVGLRRDNLKAPRVRTAAAPAPAVTAPTAVNAPVVDMGVPAAITQ